MEQWQWVEHETHRYNGDYDGTRGLGRWEWELVAGWGRKFRMESNANWRRCVVVITAPTPIPWHLFTCLAPCCYLLLLGRRREGTSLRADKLKSVTGNTTRTLWRHHSDTGTAPAASGLEFKLYPSNIPLLSIESGNHLQLQITPLNDICQDVLFRIEWRCWRRWEVVQLGHHVISWPATRRVLNEDFSKVDA